ncbi:MULTISPECIES: VWA domain-containing protein [unclassified Lentimonas]|uniref:VWA domain-containing protein n=1 Tax=unclassified Lentimonas TaxID=2630993 RepID=UPI001323D61C|nr:MULTISPECIES: VWA domain-containing protein [unclassified Lentimonas]CAA6691401.1 BatA (Bacteroides aerotolerance operon) [Lentimonas sp. CC10]CAA6693141.1 BatA (Bacteroides aerotolerance operon) [Lentimonas sp. CC19]CAA7068977.1 BatA (Bacteroides aerotolerance operon) [Lentimonas sp. CC11]
MTFENHIWLTVTPLIVLLFAGLFVFGLRRREALLSRFAAARLLDQLTEKASQQRTLLKAGLILLAFALIGVSLARPQYGVDWIERKARGLDIVFVLDSSKSMLATDLRPTRLDRAKLAIIDLVKRLESDRIGLVVFAGNAFLQTPPTLDYSAFRENLDAIGHTSLSRGGSDIGRAIREAAKAFPKDNNFKVVILLTDGEDQQQQAIETAREVAKDGIKVYTIGIGTPEGEYLKIRNAQGTEEFIRDSSGQPVRSQLDEGTLQEIAQLTGGSYSRLSDQSLNTLYNSVLATLPREERESELQEARIERYQWTLAVACVFLVLEIFIRRRGKASIQLALAIAAGTCLLPSPSEAQDIPEIPESTEPLELPLPDGEEAPEAIIHDRPTDPRILYNQAHEQLTAGNYADATRLYEEAIELSEDVELERDALYNMAHATNQIGDAAFQAQDFEAAIETWKQAEALFKSANEIDTSDSRSIEDASSVEARRKALEEFLKQQEPQDQENQDQQNQEENDEEQEQEESEDQSEDGDQSQDSEEQGEDEQSEENDEQSGDEQSGEQGEDSDQGEDGEQQSDQEGSEGEEAGEEESQESTGNPAEDMEEQAQEDEQAGSEGEESAELGEEDGQAPQPTEGQEGEQGEAAEMMLEGMSISEAQDLLDSLRSSERLLPFSEPSEEARQSNRQGEIRDW